MTTASKHEAVCIPLKEWATWFDTYRGPHNCDPAEMKLRKAISSAQVGTANCIICHTPRELAKQQSRDTKRADAFMDQSKW